MSDGRSEGRSEEEGEVRREAEPVPPLAAAAAPPRRSRGAALWLLVLLILVVAGVALSPFWAPEIDPLLPWGQKSAVFAEKYSALAARVAAIEQRPAPPPIDADAIKSAQDRLAHRIDQQETALNARVAEIEKRPAPPGIDVEAIKSTQSALASRIDRLETAANRDHRSDADIAEVKAGLQQMERRLGAIEAQAASRSTGEAADLQQTQQEISRLGKLTADFATRLTAFEHETQAQGSAERTDATLALLLAQMREAVEQARPFPAEYNAFVSLGHDPALAAAAKPLAEAARNGVASRAVLIKRLAELAGRVATAAEPAAEADWGAQALARLRGLVTIRRIDGGPQTGPEAAVSAAQAALARGDLAGAVTALDALPGANAEAARPWLAMAHDRLAVEAAFDRLQELLTARLGNPPAAPYSAPPPSPGEPAKARTPS